VDATLRPDAELVIAGRRFYLEMDGGTMGYAEVVRKRFTRYRAPQDFVLWVSRSLNGGWAFVSFQAERIASASRMSST